MARTLSSNAIAALNASETGTVFIVLLTITHPSLVDPVTGLPAPIYLSADPTTRKTVADVTSGGSDGDLDVGSGDTDIGADTDLDIPAVTIAGNGQPYYVTTSRGNDYIFLPFKIVLPDDRDDQPGLASIEMDNIDRSITRAIRSIGNTPASVLIEIVTNVTPDVVEGSFAMTLRDVTYDAQTVSGRLGFEDILAEPYPPRIVTPATVPAVFAISGG